jgi:hypothetical protein
MQISEEYIINYVFAGNAVSYAYARNYFLTHYQIEDKYHTEAEEMINGMETAGVNLYSIVLSRDMDATDILMSNSITDLNNLGLFNSEVEFGCSSISSWDTATIEDSSLSGSIILTRNMDWTPHSALLENHLLIVNFPAEEDEENWMSFIFPGIIGALSGINEHGITAFMNMGNYNNVTNDNNLHPIFLSMRNGLEITDYDQNGISDNFDVYQAILQKNHLSGSIIHSISSIGRTS